MDFGLRLLLDGMVYIRSISVEAGLDEIKSQILEAFANGYYHGVADKEKTRKPQFTSLRSPLYHVTRNR